MKRKLLIYFAALLTLSSCVGLTHVTVPRTNITVANNDIEIVRMVSYTLPKTYIFGIGGMSAKARNTNIMDKLMERAQLKPNEALAYITYSENNNCYFGVVSKVKITATGYVVKSTPRAENMAISATPEIDSISPEETAVLPLTEPKTEPAKESSPAYSSADSYIPEPKIKKERKPFTNPHGYFLAAEFGYGFECIDENNCIMLNVINGYRLSPYAAFGLGVGINSNPGNYTPIPLFVQYRSDFLNCKNSPYAALNIGTNICTKKEHKWFYDGFFAETMIGIGLDAGKSMRFNASFGLLMGRTAAYSIWSNLHYDYENEYYYEVREERNSTDFGIAPTFKIGIEF